MRSSHLELWNEVPAAIYMAVGVGGIAFGGAATLFQTAIATAARGAADVAQSMLVTAWNMAIAAGGIIGGLLLEEVGAHVFAPALLCLLVPTLIVSWAARRKTEGCLKAFTEDGTAF
ncbi:hypothetical protein [Sinorhizobium meliloti]|nr:hypothetical protein [Sinorhizobium meliloti]